MNQAMDPNGSLTMVSGAQIEPYLGAIAQLRITIFREWPYLYDGAEAYEERYLRSYVADPNSCVVLVHHSQQLVGASTALPLTAADPAFRQPFEKSGINPAEVFYFGESVLLPAWRGRGIGKAFFMERLKAARAYGSRIAAFCAVQRETNHPQRPTEYRLLDPFWQSMGFAPEPGLQAKFSWREVPTGEESENTLQFWLKRNL